MLCVYESICTDLFPNFGQAPAGLDIKVYPVQDIAARDIELSLWAGAHKAKFLSAAKAEGEFMEF